MIGNGATTKLAKKKKSQFSFPFLILAINTFPSPNGTSFCKRTPNGHMLIVLITLGFGAAVRNESPPFHARHFMSDHFMSTHFMPIPFHAWLCHFMPVPFNARPISCPSVPFHARPSSCRSHFMPCHFMSIPIPAPYWYFMPDPFHACPISCPPDFTKKEAFYYKIHL